MNAAPSSASAQPAASQESASLVKRLAGPSITKAGLAVDQTEINRIIAEASKGSKFYENEKRKDKDLTERISRILKERDELMKDVDIRHVEQAVDHLLIELESQRDLSQIIVHVDMDAFYANVELLHNPDLQGKAFGVGHGVLTTASYEARKYGVRSGMPGFIAKKLCPELILVPNTFSRYSEMSKKVMDVFKRYDPNMLAAGCDEGYLNITAYCQDHSLTSEQCVEEMRSKVREETRLTVSAGIAPNKMLAKISSDKNKPNGQFQLPFDADAIKAFMHGLSIRKIPGIGRVNERVLESIGIKTCGDIYKHRATISVMDKHFGLRFLLRVYLGIASSNVAPHSRGETKSVGVERTFSPLGDRTKLLEKLEDIANELQNDLKEGAWMGRTVTLKFKLDTYQVFTRARSFDRWISKKEDLFATGKELLIPELPLKLRLIGLRVTKLKDLRSPSSMTGIKRFFDTINHNANASPVKRQRILEDRILVTAGCEDQRHEQDDETMPGFHENEDDGADEIIDVDHDGDECVFERLPIDSAKRQPPVSAPASINVKNANQPAPGTSTVSKPRSVRQPDQHTNSLKNAKPATEKIQAMECPICAKHIETDNEGLNAHIDFCLSRGAIRQAHAEASPNKQRNDTASDEVRLRGAKGKVRKG